MRYWSGLEVFQDPERQPYKIINAVSHLIRVEGVTLAKLPEFGLSTIPNVAGGNKAAVDEAFRCRVGSKSVRFSDISNDPLAGIQGNHVMEVDHHLATLAAEKFTRVRILGKYQGGMQRCHLGP
jgi:hypothetical protein